MIERKTELKHFRDLDVYKTSFPMCDGDFSYNKKVPARGEIFFNRSN